MRARGMILPGVSMALTVATASADVIKVLHPQGSAHGFVDVTTLEGSRIGVGDLIQRAHSGVVSSRLVLHFFDGSVDDETTVYSQNGVFRLMSDHHVQHGPSFPKSTDTTLDVGKGLVTSRDEDGKISQAHIDCPPDTYNGLASTMLMNFSAKTTAATLSVVVPSAKPRLVHLAMKQAGQVTFTLGGVERTGIDYVVHVELGGVAGVVAPLIGKQPPDYHVWIMAGPDPAFIREQGPLYEDGPVWQIQQVSAVFAK